MKIRLLHQGDSSNILALWNECTLEEDFIYKKMTLSQIHSKFISSNDFSIITLGIFLEKELIGFSSGVVIDNNHTGYISAVVVKKQLRRTGIGTKLLEELELNMILHSKSTLHKLDIIFYNPINLEWVISNGNDYEHPNAPGVDIDSEAYRFYKKNGYIDYTILNVYYKNIKDYQYSNSTLVKMEILHKNNIRIDYYYSTLHFGFNYLFDDLKNELWRDSIFKNIYNKNEKLPVLVVHRNGEICGFTGPLIKQDNQRGSFEGIGIHSNCRGLGAGSVLFSALCKGLKDLGAEYMTLFTGDTNPARHIYEKEDFKIIKSWMAMRKMIH